jgi:ribosomal protein L37AE/L43A
MVEREMKICPFCGRRSIRSNSRSRTYRCDNCKNVFAKSKAVVKTVNVTYTKAIPDLLSEGIRKHRQKAEEIK